MAKWVCNVCGYVYEGDAAPEVCPVCKAPASKFTKHPEQHQQRVQQPMSGSHPVL